MKFKDRETGLLLIAVLVFALLGQYYLAYERDYAWDGLVFWALALLLAGLLLWRQRRVESGPPRLRLRDWLPDHALRTIYATGGLLLSGVAGRLALERADGVAFTDLLMLWIAGVVWFLVAFLPPLPLRELWSKVRRHLHDRRVELLGLVVMLVVALAVRAYDLEQIPANLGGDEGTQGMAALELISRPLGNPFSTGWYSVPTMSFLAYGLSMRLFGATVAGLRTLSALVGTATILTTFLLARELWGRRVAWLSTPVLVVSHYHIHFSRLGSNQIIDALFITLALWLLARGLRTRRPIEFALLGVTIGMGWYGYFGARLVGIVVVCYLALQLVVRSQFIARYGRLTLILLAGVLVVMGPLLLHYVEHAHTLASRFRQVSIFASGWLAREQEITGKSAVSLLLQQFWKSVSAFNYTLDPTFWYHASVPLLDIISGVAFVLGLAWSVAHYRWPSSNMLLVWFCLAVLLGWVTTENPPSSQRMVVAAPALALFVGLGINWLIELGGRLVERDDLLRRGTVTVVLLAVASLNLGFYFLVYTPRRVYGNPTAEMTTVLARYLNEQDDDYVVHFHGAPHVYWDFGTLQFMARSIDGVNVPPPDEGEPPEPDLSRGVRFVFYPPRMDELDDIRARYPGGEDRYVFSSADGELLYVLYEIRRPGGDESG